MTRTRPLQIVTACAIVVVEAMCLLALGVVEAIQVDSARIAVALTTALFFCLYSGGLLVAAGALWKLRGWSRGPIVLAQLIQLGVAWSFSGGDTTEVAVGLVIPACVCLGLVVSPATTHALYPELVASDDREGTEGHAS